MTWTIENVKRSYTCNGAMLKYYREKKGWTQNELSAVSGYRERMLSKAENGGSILSSTIDVLAESLSTEDDPLYPEDLITDPLKLAQDYNTVFHVHQKETVKEFRDFLDDDFTIKIAGDPASIPFAGEYHGLQEAERYYHLLFSFLEVPKDYDHRPLYQYIVEGKNVVSMGQCWIHPIGRPLKKPMKISCHFKFQRGKLILFDEFYDTHSAAKMIQGDD